MNVNTATPMPASTVALLKDLRWRISDTRDQLMRSRCGAGEESLYGIDEWSTPAVNLQLAIDLIDQATGTAA